MWPVKIVPDMTYDVFGGTLNPTLATIYINIITILNTTSLIPQHYGCRSGVSTGSRQCSNTDRKPVRGATSDVSSSSSDSFLWASSHSVGRRRCPLCRCSCRSLRGTQSAAKQDCRVVVRRSPSTVAGSRCRHWQGRPRSHTVRTLPDGNIRRVSSSLWNFFLSVLHRTDRCPCLFYRCSRCSQEGIRRRTKLDSLEADLHNIPQKLNKQAVVSPSLGHWGRAPLTGTLGTCPREWDTGDVPLWPFARLWICISCLATIVRIRHQKIITIHSGAHAGNILVTSSAASKSQVTIKITANNQPNS